MRVNRRKKKEQRRASVRTRVRKKITGTLARPRVTVFRSNRHLHLQVVDDGDGHTLASVSTLEKAFRDQGFEWGSTVPAATAAGTMLAERALEAGVKKVVFDRNGYDYHGRIRAAAEAAREAGLEF